MQGTAEFHHHIADAVLPQPNAVFHGAAALDTAVHMLDPQATVMQSLVGQLLLQRQFLARAGRCRGLCRYRDPLDLKVHVRIPTLKNSAQLPVERPHSRL